MNIFKRIYLTVKNPTIDIKCSHCGTVQKWSFRMNQDQRPFKSRIWCPICGSSIFISQEMMEDMFDLVS